MSRYVAPPAQEVFPGMDIDWFDDKGEVILVRAEQELKARFDAKLAANGEAKDFLTGKKVRRYKRSIHKRMAKWLIALYKESWLQHNHARKYIHINDLPLERGGDYAKLKLWGLIQELPRRSITNIRGDGSTRVGWFRLTRKGEMFVEGKIPLPKIAYVIEGNLHGFGGPDIKIHQIIEGFNYESILP